MGTLIYAFIANIITGVVVIRHESYLTKDEAILATLLGWIILPLAILGYIYAICKRFTYK